ncbi:MAG: FAD-dependent oxidoreductase [Streptosporangiales bacterium]|nr:FAD-dependent oxidoreductase [Streptosporangiales bacterium]
MESTTCCIVGGGPAGAMLGLLLARAGVDVVVLEKHADFLRDFRGDTVHPSTLELLDELGLAERFAELPQEHAPTLSMVTDEGPVTVAEFSALRHPHPYIAFVPQWDFLAMLTDEAGRYPTFTLKMQAEAHDLIREGGRVRGVRYRDRDGEHELRAQLTVAADGRHSALRCAAGLTPVGYGVPMDVVWFRLSRRESDPRQEVALRLVTGGLMAYIGRGTYWQIAYIVLKGGYERLMSAGLDVLRAEIVSRLPFLADRVGELADWNDLSVLDVRIDRLRRWYVPGLLCIGDAAHAMSPVGGVGINLAIQDAVAAANLLAEPLLRGHTSVDDLAKVQQRREMPAAATQWMQRVLQARFIGPLLRGTRPPVPPLPARLLSHFRPGRHLIAHLIGVGARPEHVRLPVPDSVPRG